MNISTLKLADAVPSLDRLNSFVRTTASHSCDGLFRDVYAMKDAALKLLDDAGAVTARNIFVMAKCRPCHGSGEWEKGPRWDRRYEPCWHCVGAGKTRLDFREFTIGRTLGCLDWPHEDIRWHQPMRRESPTATESHDWKPRQPGREMTADEVAGALNATEPLLAPPWPSTYRLYLGKFGGVCAFCPSTVDLLAHGARRGRLAWARDVCAECQKHFHALGPRYGTQGLVHQRLRLPDEAMTPEVMKWVDRHGGMSRVLATSPEMECA